jgi:hypothetical protein
LPAAARQMRWLSNSSGSPARAGCCWCSMSAPPLQRTLLFSSSSDRVAQMLSRRPGGCRVVSDAAADPVRHLPLAIGHKVLGGDGAPTANPRSTCSLQTSGAHSLLPAAPAPARTLSLAIAALTRGLRDHRPLQRGVPHGALPVHAAARAPPRPRPCRRMHRATATNADRVPFCASPRELHESDSSE